MILFQFTVDLILVKSKQYIYALNHYLIVMPYLYLYHSNVSTPETIIITLKKSTLRMVKANYGSSLRHVKKSDSIICLIFDLW